MGADLSGYDFCTIATALKRFLLELPDSVIPVQWYHKFIDVSGKILSVCHTLYHLLSRNIFTYTFSGMLIGPL
jgi:predicted nuclease of restriction endonuclease-like (RecB) superfamily